MIKDLLIWGGDFEDLQLKSKCNKEFRFLLCVMCYWVFPLKDTKGITISNALFKKIDKSNRKPNHIWIDKGSEFYDRSIKSWLHDSDIEMFSTHYEGKFVVAERFIRTF